eukprot:2216851-Pyramimonas_sp.AAC.1
MLSTGPRLAAYALDKPAIGSRAGHMLSTGPQLALVPGTCSGPAHRQNKTGSLLTWKAIS